MNATLLLVEARLYCKDLTTAQDPVLLSKVITEMGNFTLAIQLTMAHDLSPAYPLAQMYRKQNFEDMSEEV